jgi:DNA-binding transcriptional ArsR family regulator
MANAKPIVCIKMLKALGDETRWRIVQALLKETFTVNGLSEKLGATQYNVSKHIRILREAGIVQQTKTGREVNCGIVPEFRQRLARGKNELDLGCCTFRFDP